MSNPVFAWIVTGVGVLFVLISAFADPGAGRRLPPRSRASADTPGHPPSAISAVHEPSDAAAAAACRERGLTFRQSGQDRPDVAGR